MTFFDEDMQSHDVTMQELQLAAQEQFNYSLIGEELPNRVFETDVSREASAEAISDFYP